MATAAELKEALEVLEAQRLVETVKLRNELIREAASLVPEAVRQAKGTHARKRRDGTRAPAKPGNSTLLKLLSTIAMADVQKEK